MCFNIFYSPYNNHPALYLTKVFWLKCYWRMGRVFMRSLTVPSNGRSITSIVCEPHSWWSLWTGQVGRECEKGHGLWFLESFWFSSVRKILLSTEETIPVVIVWTTCCVFSHRLQRWFWYDNNLWDCWENHPFQFGTYSVNIFVVEWISLLLLGNLCSNFGFTVCNLQATFLLWAHLSSFKSDQNKWCLNSFI